MERDVKPPALFSKYGTAIQFGVPLYWDISKATIRQEMAGGEFLIPHMFIVQ